MRYCRRIHCASCLLSPASSAMTITLLAVGVEVTTWVGVRVRVRVRVRAWVRAYKGFLRIGVRRKG